MFSVIIFGAAFHELDKSREEIYDSKIALILNFSDKIEEF